MALGRGHGDEDRMAREWEAHVDGEERAEEGHGTLAEYYVVWEETAEAVSLSGARFLARQKAQEGKGAVQVRSRVVEIWTDADGVAHRAVVDDDCVQDTWP